MKPGNGPWAVLLLAGVMVLLYAGPSAAAVEPSWLEAVQPPSWNAIDPGVPIAPAQELPIDPRVEARERQPETDEDAVVLEAGWRLFGAYQAGWGVTVLQATSGYDGMGRPWGYQAFVFVDDRFAGTLSPDPMKSRTDGALDNIVLLGRDAISASFRRYTERDPLCCPSGRSAVQYRIERPPEGPLVVPQSVSTEPLGD